MPSAAKNQSAPEPATPWSGPDDRLSPDGRRIALERMANEEFDVVVVGGGITGAGVALDAATRGYSVALVERADFASGTSSRSSKLVHGGLRYLQNFDLGLVREALLERQLMVALAPHLVRPLPLVVAAFDGAHPDRLVGVESINRAGDHVFGRKILGLNRSIEPEQAADLSFDLKAALA